MMRAREAGESTCYRKPRHDHCRILRTPIWSLGVTHESTPMTALDHLRCQRRTAQFTGDLHKCGLDGAALWPVDIRQPGRTEDDGVLVAQLGEGILS